ncbi:MAG: DUF3108 domain-containing protein [Chitinophagaceae bacterium]|nr:MAG: DUF3108 domain-containing protein [Chitinophagaceae bacterium]
MKKLSICFVLAICLFGPGATTKAPFPQAEICGGRNVTTQNSEQIMYIVYYTVAGIYVNAGNATFTNSVERLNGKPVFHITANGATNTKYDWIFKVRDKYESYIDTTTMQPLKFVRDVSEGNHKHYENITFNHAANTAVTKNGVYKVPDCVQDVISAVYSARNIDFDRYKKDDKIPFKLFLDNEVYDMYIRYMGREDVKTKYGKFRAHKFRPLLIKGTIFEGGEKMTVWVSDDANRVPLRIESPIVVGSVKIDMMSYRNLRYPLSSLKKFNGQNLSQ